jgi:stage II sporulation protein P
VLPLWSDVPAVLLVNTHPYEGYGDGSPYYDPAAGGLALVDTPHAPDGTVALTAALSRALRDRGIAVIHLRVSTTAGESAASVHARTEELIRQYCRFYPDVGLILDIGRSAELTESGGILRTAGSLEGAPCAQLGIGVSGGREEASLGRDLSLALALRQALFGHEPTLSRPVEVGTGDGPVPDREEVRVLSLSLGSAGNTFAEAERLVRPLAEALSAVLEKY